MSESLIDIPENPAPDWGEVSRFTARDGRSIRYGRFPAQSRPLKGTVIILSGRNECIEKYFETIRDLSARGFGSAIMDWRGQGGSDRLIKDRAKGYVDSFDQYVADLELFFDHVILPDCRAPYYVLGHSTGALVALIAMPRLFNRVRRMVLSTPLVEFAGLPVSMKTLRRMTAVLYNLGLGSLYVSGGPRPADGYPFAANKLTTDLARYTRNTALYNAAPDLAMGGPTVAWIHAACVAAERLRDPDFVATLHVPTLIVAAGADEVVSSLAIESFARTLRSGSVVTIDGARHELLQEADIYREQFWAAFDAFIPGDNPDQ